MSRSDSQELESQLFDDVEGLLKEYFQNNLRDQKANQSFLKASLKFLYRQLEKRLEIFSSGLSSKKSSSRTENNIFSFGKQGDPSQCLPPLGYQDKVRYWASRYLHAGRSHLSRSSSSIAASRESVQPKGPDIKLSNIIESGESPKQCCFYLQNPDRIGGCTTPTSATSSEDRVLIIVSSGVTERVHNCESCVSLEAANTSAPSVTDYKKNLLINKYENTASADPLVNHSVWKKEQNNTEKEDKLFKIVTQSLQVTAQESINDLSNTQTFNCDSSSASGPGLCKDPSVSEGGVKDVLRVSLSHDIAQEEPTSSTKPRSPSSRIHAAILNLFASKNSEKKNGNKSGYKSSKSCTGGSANPYKDEDIIKNIKRILSKKLSMHSTGQGVASHQRDIQQNTISVFSEKSSGVLKSEIPSFGDRKSTSEKLKKLKVCQIPFMPVCQSCDQICTYLSSGRTTRDVATCTEDLITGYSKCKRCFSCVSGSERSDSIFSELHCKFGHRDQIEELSILFLCALLKDLGKRNRNMSSKMNPKSKRRTSQFPDVKSYGVTSWPLSIRRHRENRAKTQQLYGKSTVNAGLLRQPSKFSAWNGDENTSDSDDEEYRLKRTRLLAEMSGKRLRSSLVIRSSRASEHIPSSKR